MEISTTYERVSLPLAVPFEIARGEQREAENVILRLEDGDGERGIGGAAPAEYYGETVESVLATLPKLLAVVEEHAVELEANPETDREGRAEVGAEGSTEAGGPAAIERRIADATDGQGPGPDAPAARAAVSAACYDLFARLYGDPLYEIWGLDPTDAPQTSFTVGIADPQVMAERAAATVAEGFEILKVKLGTDADRERLEAVRAAAPDARIRVDANGAWSSDEAVANTDWLAALGVEFLEQPVPAEDVAGLRRVHEEGAVPVAADESCVTAADVPRVTDAADTVVVKLMKCGGLGPARRAIAAAHDHGLSVLLGCMVESNASIAAACHLAPLVEYVDLDGALLLASDRYDGVPMPGGRIDLASVDRGTGARAKPAESG